MNDFNIQYSLEKPWIFREIVITGLVNNIFNEKYVSNGYYYTYNVPNEDLPSGVQTLDGAGYYPQATTNFLLGLTLNSKDFNMVLAASFPYCWGNLGRGLF